MTVLNLSRRRSDKQIQWWKSVGFKKDSLFSTGKQKGSEVKVQMGERVVWSRLLLLNTADGLDLRGLAVGAKLPEVFKLPTVTITLHDILVSTITRILVAHKSVEKSQRQRERKRKEVLMKCCKRWLLWKSSAGLFLKWGERAEDTHAPDWILREPTSLLHQPMAWREG